MLQQIKQLNLNKRYFGHRRKLLHQYLQIWFIFSLLIFHWWNRVLQIYTGTNHRCEHHTSLQSTFPLNPAGPSEPWPLPSTRFSHWSRFTDDPFRGGGGGDSSRDRQTCPQSCFLKPVSPVGKKNNPICPVWASGGFGRYLWTCIRVKTSLSCRTWHRRVDGEGFCFSSRTMNTIRNLLFRLIIINTQFSTSPRGWCEKQVCCLYTELAPNDNKG